MAVEGPRQSDIILIDGNHLLFRVADRLYELECPHPEIKGETIGTGGIYGFIRVLSFVCRRYGGMPIVCWEGGNNFRYKLYPQYKAGRGERDVASQLWYEDMMEQQQYIWKILEDVGVDQAWSPGYEADDTIGTLAHTFASDGEFVYIYSGDRDLFQCVTERVHQVRQHKKVETIETPETIHDSFGIWPSQWIEYMALKGDGGDNIKGVKGIGEKKAAVLIQQYSTVEKLYDALDSTPDSVATPSVRKLLFEGREDAELAMKLVTISTNAGITLVDGVPDKKKCIRWFKKFRIKDFLDLANLNRIMAMGGA